MSDFAYELMVAAWYGMVAVTCICLAIGIVGVTLIFLRQFWIDSRKGF